MKKKYFFLLFLLFFLQPIHSQIQLSVYAEVSIVTVGPGSELYAAFGHSALRIKDPVLNLDLIYNYGIFDFNQPNFYSNFAKGNMVYTLARYDFKYFLAEYTSEKRWVKEQVLNLNQKEKNAYFQFLEQNAQPQNAKYNYDPYFNNCATILIDITNSVLGNKVEFNHTSFSKKETLRSLMNKELYWNSWGSLGINLIAGTILDKVASPPQYMYLPDYVFNAFKNAKIFVKNQPEKLVKKEVLLLNFKEPKKEVGWLNPFLIFTILGIWGLYITYTDYKNQKRTKILDFTLFFVTGFIGALLLFLWLFSTHSTAPNNFNILWAVAPNFLVAFLFLKNEIPKWVSIYAALLLLFLILLIIIWILKVPIFSIVIIAFLILLFVRYIFLLKLKVY